MTGLQSCIMTSFANIEHYLREHENELKGLPGFIKQRDEFELNLSLLQTLAKKQKHVLEGLTRNKKKTRLAMTELTLDMSVRLVALAVATEDETLAKIAKVTKRMMTLARSSKVRLIASMIYELAMVKKDALLPFDVDEACLAALKTAIDQYAELEVKPREGIAVRKEATQEIAGQIRYIRKLLKKLDSLVSLKPAVYPGFQKMRKVVNPGMRHLDMKGFVKDAATDEGVHGATLLFYAADEHGNADTNSKPVLTKRSNKKGGFQSRHMAEGVYKLVVLMPGYQKMEMKVYVTKGVMCRVEVELLIMSDE